MTCIAACRDEEEGKIYVASDRRLSYDNGFVTALGSPKVVQIHDLWVGSAGDSFTCQLAEEALAQLQAEIGVMLSPSTVASEFHRYLRPLLREAECDQGEATELELLVICHGRVLVGDKHVLVETQGPWAIGEGAPYAPGAMWKLPPSKATAIRGVQAAIAHCSSCGGPVDSFTHEAASLLPHSHSQLLV